MTEGISRRAAVFGGTALFAPGTGTASAASRLLSSFESGGVEGRPQFSTTWIAGARLQATENYPGVQAYLFDQLVRVATEAQRSGRFNINLAMLAGEAIAQLQQVLGAVELRLRNAAAQIRSADEFVVTGAVHGAALKPELRFYRAPGGADYAITIATGRPLRLLPEALRSIAALADVEALWWTVASRPVEAATVTIRGFEAQALRFRQGMDNFHLRLKNPVLKALDLEKSVFELALADRVPSLTTALAREFRLPPFLTARFNRVSLAVDGTLSFDSEVRLRLLGRDIPKFSLDLQISPVRILVPVPVPFDLQLPEELPWKSIVLTDNRVLIEGRLGAPGYGYGVDGRFKLPGTGHGGTYYFQYNAGNPGPVPDTLELTAETLTASDALNIVSPAVVLPQALDQWVVIRNAYLTYAVAPNARSRSGKPIQQGSSLRAEVQVFGEAGYLAVQSAADGVQAAILTNPFRIGRVVALRGTGVQSPPGYSGPPFDPDAIEIRLDTRAGTATAGIQLDFLGKPLQRIQASVSAGVMTLSSRVSLPLTVLDLEVSASAAGSTVEGAFAFEAGVDLPLVNGFNLRGLGKVNGSVRLEQPAGQAPRSTVTAKLVVLGFAVSTSFFIDPEDIARIGELALRALYDKAREVLAAAVDFVKAFLQGAVKYTLQAAEAIRALAQTLVREFGATAEEAVRIMKNAGASAVQALSLVRQGAEAFARFTYSKVVQALKSHFPEQAIGAMRDWAEHFGRNVKEFAENVAWLMKQGGYAIEAIATEVWRYVGSLGDRAEALVRSLTWGGLGSRQIASELKKVGVPVEAAVRAIGDVFGTDRIEAALVPVYGGDAARIVGNVVREMGRFSRDVEREVRNGLCRRIGICL
jgi:hypothetical protein